MNKKISNVMFFALALSIALNACLPRQAASQESEPCYCGCTPIGKDPGIIRIGPNPGDDYLSVHGRLTPKTAIDPATEPMSVRLSNVNGTIYSLAIPAGTISRLGQYQWRFFDNRAKGNKNGLVEVKVLYDMSGGYYDFWFSAYGDLSKATLADMVFNATIGDDCFFTTDTWTETKTGWQADFQQ